MGERQITKSRSECKRLAHQAPQLLVEENMRLKQSLARKEAALVEADRLLIAWDEEDLAYDVDVAADAYRAARKDAG